MVDRLCSYPLLIIDDFGIERGTEYALEQVYNIIDARYRSKNAADRHHEPDLNGLKESTGRGSRPHVYDRLLSMCSPICFAGRTYGSKQQHKKRPNMRSLMKSTA